MWRISQFYREHKEIFVIVGGFAATIAGFVVMILGHIFPGLLLLFAGLIGWLLGFKRILTSGGYDPEDAMSRGLKGQGRQQSEMHRTTPTHTEVDSSIWGKMTNDNNEK